MVFMKNHDVLQAHPSQQAHSQHLKVYEKIRLSERGKAVGIPLGYKTAKNNKRLNYC